MAVNTTYQNQVDTMYIAYFGRPVDPSGEDYYSNLMASKNGSFSAMNYDFFMSKEAQDIYGSMGINAKVNAFYQNLFGHDADAAGLTYWVGLINAGTITLPDAAYTIAFNAGAADAAILAAKLASAKIWTTHVDSSAEILAYEANAAAGRTFLSTVTTSTAATATAVDAAILAMVNGTVITGGQTFTLTTGVDTVNGTSGDDTINGVVDAANNGGTLTAGDVIDGKGGSDSLNAIITTAAKWPAGATISNVETINIKNVTGGSDTLNVSNIAGATKFVVNGGAAGTTLTLNNIQSNAMLSLANTGNNAALAATFKDGTVGIGGTVSVDVNGVGSKVAGFITRGAVTVGHAGAANTATDVTLALTATGANYVTFTDGANSIGGLKTVTVGGDGSLDVVKTVAEFNNLTTVNAAANKGGVTIDLTGNNKDVTFTGGSGNDVLTLSNFNGTDTLNGGDGMDTLNVSLANVQAFTKAAPITNFETLGITLGGALAADTTVNGDYFGVTNVSIADAINLATFKLNLSNLGQGANVTFTTSASSAGTINVDVKGAVAGTNDSATLSFGKGVDLNTSAVVVTAAGVETMNIATSTTKGAGAQLNTLTDAALTTVKITGSDGFTLGTLSGAAVATIDASGVVKDAVGAVGVVSISAVNSTHAVTFTGGQGADTYTGSNKGDTVTGGLGLDTIALGTGADKLIYNAAAESDGVVVKDAITLFNTTADSIQFAASLLKGAASYLGAAAFDNAGHTELRMNGADLQVDLDGNGTADMIITLTGVTAATFGASNFSFA